ncbi:MAG: hypothetical protein ACJ8F1_15365 [Polyangia bacterium]
MVRGVGRRVFAAFAVVASAVMGCSSGAHAPADAGSCGCYIDPTTHALQMSLDCYCAAHDCRNAAPVACSGSSSPYSWTVACGLNVFTSPSFGGPFYAVTDQSGTLVGFQATSDTTLYSCPTDPTLTALVVRAGRFPDAACAVQDCACDAGAPCTTTQDAGADH